MTPQQQLDLEHLLWRRDTTIFKGVPLSKIVADTIEKGTHKDQQFTHDGLVIQYKNDAIMMWTIRNGNQPEDIVLTDFEQHAIKQSVELWMIAFQPTTK